MPTGTALRDRAYRIRALELHINLQVQQLFEQPKLLSPLEEAPRLGRELVEIASHGELAPVASKREHDARRGQLPSIQRVAGAEQREHEAHLAAGVRGFQQIVKSQRRHGAAVIAREVRDAAPL